MLYISFISTDGVYAARTIDFLEISIDEAHRAGLSSDTCEDMAKAVRVLEELQLVELLTEVCMNAAPLSGNLEGTGSGS